MLQVTLRVADVTTVEVHENGHPSADPETNEFSVIGNDNEVLATYDLDDVDDVSYKPGR